MDNSEFEDLISAYIENDLPQIKRKEVESYLVDNPSQSQLVKNIANNIECLKRSPKIIAKQDFNQRLMGKIKARNFYSTPEVNKGRMILGFSFLNASALVGLISIVLILSLEVTGLMPTFLSERSIQFVDNEKVLGNDILINQPNEENISDISPTKFQSDSTKKEKVDFSRNIKYVND